MNLALRTVMATMRLAGGASRLSCLIYHRVFAVDDPLFPEQVTIESFDSQMAAVVSEFNVISLSEAVSGLERGVLPVRAACITFDDGYADNYDLALPILLKHGIPACFFVATGFLDGGIMWNDSIIEAVRNFHEPVLDLSHIALGCHSTDSVESKRRAIDCIIDRLKHRPFGQRADAVAAIVAACGASPRSDLMMSSTQVQALARAGMEIGGHTVNHPILTQVDAATARQEIVHGRRHLQEMTGTPVSLFAYPNGRPCSDYASEHVGMVREAGYQGAVSTAWGAASPGADVFQIPRFTPWDKTAWRFLLRLTMNRLSQSYERTAVTG
jgi:peptidoglycan/xylan/chitin deacetylase (PgdA/CDA1 family)